jgi:hypothetical protein
VVKAEDNHRSGEELEDFVAEAGVPGEIELIVTTIGTELNLPPLSSVSAVIKKAISLTTVPLNGMKRENNKGMRRSTRAAPPLGVSSHHCVPSQDNRIFGTGIQPRLVK